MNSVCTYPVGKLVLRLCDTRGRFSLSVAIFGDSTIFGVKTCSQLIRTSNPATFAP
jgi:hypothetical protein